MSESPRPAASATTSTMADIARVVGISQSGVSLALRGSTRIAEATRARVQKVASDLGYHPNPLGAGLAHFRRSSKVQPVHAALAWLNLWPKPEQLHGYKQFELTWRGGFNAAERRGYRLDEFPVNSELNPHRLQKVLLTRGIRGLLIPPAPASTIDWKGFDWSQFTAVRLGRGSPAGIPQFNLVTSAQSANAAMALLRMSEMGYKRVGLICYRTQIWTYLGGFVQAQLVNLPEDRRVTPFLLDETIPDSLLLNRKAVQGIMDSFTCWRDKWRPDALLTDTAAVAQLLSLAGKRVPQDIGVAGLSVLDLPFDAGIDQNPEESGCAAVLQLISQITDNDHGVPSIRREILVQGQWTDGKSLPPAVRKTKRRR